MKEFTVKIKPLTPIWTGDENKKCETLRETGIIGSLRWWYETLVRGLGGSACDPTNTKCDGENHCDVCELFGCTGWARKFRLEVESDKLAVIPEIKIGTREKRVIRRKEKKYLIRNVRGLMADRIVLKFILMRDITPNEWALLNQTLQIIAEHGAIGAFTAQGNGVIKIVENNLPYRDRKSENAILKKEGNTIGSPNLYDFFFYKFHVKFKEDILNLIDKKVFWTHSLDHDSFKDDWENWKELWSNYHFLPIAFHIRDALRHLEDDKNKRHEMFGELGKGSRVFVSHGYKIDDKTVEIRIWGYNVEKSIKNKMGNKEKKECESELVKKLKERLFSKEEYQQHLERCTLENKESGKQLLEESE